MNRYYGIIPQDSPKQSKFTDQPTDQWLLWAGAKILLFTSEFKKWIWGSFTCSKSFSWYKEILSESAMGGCRIYPIVSLRSSTMIIRLLLPMFQLQSRIYFCHRSSLLSSFINFPTPTELKSSNLWRRSSCQYCPQQSGGFLISRPAIKERRKQLKTFRGRCRNRNMFHVRGLQDKKIVSVLLLPI